MQSVIDWVLNIWEHYPDLGVLVIGSVSGWLLTVGLELYFMPIATDPETKRRQKGYTFLFCWLVTAFISSMLWWVLDPIDPLRLRVTVSTVVSIMGWFAYPTIAKYLTSKFPSIGSAWSKIE